MKTNLGENERDCFSVVWMKFKAISIYLIVVMAAISILEDMVGEEYVEISIRNYMN